MASILPFVAHGDTLPVVKISAKFEGNGTARREIGTQFNALLLFDNCAQVPITVPGLDVSKMPSPELVSERNMSLKFLVVKFKNLAITFTGGDFGAIRYKGSATGVEFLNLTPPAVQSHSTPSK